VHGSLHGPDPQHPRHQLPLHRGRIVGATVMPHVIYLHSALTKGRMPTRNDHEKKRVLRFERLDVYIALGLGGTRQPGDAPPSPPSCFTPQPSPASARSPSTRPVRTPRRRHRRARVRPSRCSPPAPPPPASAPTPPGRDGRLHQLSDTPRATPRDHDDPRAHHTRDRHQPHQRCSSSAQVVLPSGSRSRSYRWSCSPAAATSGAHVKLPHPQNLRLDHRRRDQPQ